jgi:hypothetical protein
MVCLYINRPVIDQKASGGAGFCFPARHCNMLLYRGPREHGRPRSLANLTCRTISQGIALRPGSLGEASKIYWPSQDDLNNPVLPSMSPVRLPNMLLDLFLNFRVVILSLCLVAWYVARRNKRGDCPLPPGPKSFPIIGNLLDMPTRDEWVTFGKWSKEFGSAPVLAFQSCLNCCS